LLPFKTSALQESLKHQCHSLVELSLTHALYDFLVDDDTNEMSPMVFRDFSNLKILEISLPFIFGQETLQFGKNKPRRDPEALNPTLQDMQASKGRLVDMLPTSIETLRLAQCGDVWAAQILDYALIELVRLKKRFSALKHIEIHCYNWGEVEGRTFPELWRSFFEADRAGISMKMFKGGRLGRTNVEDGWLTTTGVSGHDLVEVVGEEDM
jgi:hypothetical protein